MSAGQIHDPQGAKTVTLSFKTAAGATLPIARHNIKIICLANVQTSKLHVDADAAAGGKQQMSAQGRCMVLIYRTNMHVGPTLSPKCAQKNQTGTPDNTGSSTLFNN